MDKSKFTEPFDKARFLNGDTVFWVSGDKFYTESDEKAGKFNIAYAEKYPLDHLMMLATRRRETASDWLMEALAAEVRKPY